MFQYSKVLFVLLVLAFGLGVECRIRKNTTTEKQQEPAVKSKPNPGIGISAWGLVFLIVSLILLGVAAYYIALFYPIICEKERKYNRIELAPV